MARNKDSRITTDELFNQDREEEVNTVNNVRNESEKNSIEVGNLEVDDPNINKPLDESDKSKEVKVSKESKKVKSNAQYIKRTSLCITSENHIFLKIESAKKNITITELINTIIDEYRQKQM